MKPTPSLQVRLRFSTKDVGKGFYRGNRTGSMGAHTPKGGYLIDYRKVRNYKVPDLKNFPLTPFVTREIGENEAPEEKYYWEDENNDTHEYFTAQDLTTTRRTRAMKFLKEWRNSNPREFQRYVDHQKEHDLEGELERYRLGERVEIFERFRQAEKQSRDAANVSGSQRP